MSNDKTKEREEADLKRWAQKIINDSKAPAKVKEKAKEVLEGLNNESDSRIRR